jgi:hypothetical protein
VLSLPNGFYRLTTIRMNTSSVSRAIRIIFFLLLLSSPAFSQIDLYEKVLDPLAIADLSDLRPLKGVCFVGIRGPLQNDGSRLIASDDGKGIITHIWMTVDHGVADSSTEVRIVIDDTTVIKTSLRGVGRLQSQLLRPPFDTTMSGGAVCDVQMPYSRRFRVYYKGPYLFCAIMWRPLASTTQLASFADSQDAYAAQQRLAELAYWNKTSPWSERSSDSIRRSVAVDPGQSLDLLTLNGPALIHTIEFFNRTSWVDYQDSLLLEVHWDDNPRPGILLPLTDFMGQGAGLADLNAFQQRASANWCASYLPMPFVRSARVQLVNRSSQSLSLDTRILWSPLDTAGKRYGNLVTAFNVSAPTKYGIDHKLIDQLGSGRYIGCHVAVPQFDFGYFLEGDYQFKVDGQNGNSWRYTGTEDYFNGAWYFEDSIFSLPFAGCTRFPNSLYRFHYLDAVDFNDSLHLSCEHGHLSTVSTHYRSTAFLYLEPQDFWPLQDTVLAGGELKIEGFGWPGEQIDFYLNDRPIGRTIVDAGGGIRHSPIIDLPGGIYRLHDGRRSYNRNIVILSGPTISVDTSQKYGPFNYRDLLPIHGSGFKPGEQITFSVDTFDIEGNGIADQDGDLHFLMSVPYTPTFERVIMASGNSGSVCASPTYSWSRTLAFEAELQPKVPELYPEYMLWWGIEWSRLMTTFMYSADPQSTLDIDFAIPVSDTFYVELYHNTCMRYGNYEVLIDNVRIGEFSGYSDHGYHDPQRAGPVTFGPVRIDRGEHVLGFVGKGRHPEAVENSIGIDNFLLRPSTAFSASALAHTLPRAGQWTLYPSPVNGDVLYLTYTGESPEVIPTSAFIRDMLGRTVASDVKLAGDTSSGAMQLRIDLPRSVSAGPYFLELSGGSTYKFIKIAD